MPEGLSKSEIEDKNRTGADQITEVVTSGEDDSRRWQEKNEDEPEQQTEELEIIPVSVGTRGLGEYNRQHHRVETVALYTGHFTLRHLMPEIEKTANY